MNNLIEEKIKTKELYYKIDLHRQYYSNKAGTIKGIKKLQHKILIYLIEFLDHNRIWVMHQEIDQNRK